MPLPCIAFSVKYSDHENMTTVNERLTAISLKEHLEWQPISGAHALISVCGTRSKAISEANWRLRDGRTNIKITHISTQRLRWDVLVLSRGTRLDVLVDFNYVWWVIFVRATDLTQAFGVGELLKQEVDAGAREEWFAID